MMERERHVSLLGAGDEKTGVVVGKEIMLKNIMRSGRRFSGRV